MGKERQLVHLFRAWSCQGWAALSSVDHRIKDCSSPGFDGGILGEELKKSEQRAQLCNMQMDSHCSWVPSASAQELNWTM